MQKTFKTDNHSNYYALTQCTSLYNVADYMGKRKNEAGLLLSPLCTGSARDDIGEDKDTRGSCTSTACAGPTAEMVVETDKDEEEDMSVGEGPHTLSVSLVPGVSSTSPWA